MHTVKAWWMLLASIAFVCSTQVVQAQVNGAVLVSTHPMALLIKSAWPELTIETLMQPNQSPHDFALRPSHRQSIARSQHLIWLGQEMEPYLSKVIGSHPSSLDLSILFEEAHDEHMHADEHHHGEHDPHIWLNPEAIPAILAKVQSQLAIKEPTEFLTAFEQWQNKAKAQLSGQSRGFVSFHDAFHYWVNYFHLNQVAVMAIHPEQPIGTRHLVQVKQLLEQGNVACLFIEPQFKASIVEKLQRGTNVPIMNIDPIGSQFSVNEGKFLQFYDELVQKFSACLKTK